MSDLPAPLTPANCDLRDFPRMMIDINRIFGSSFNAKASRNPLAWMVAHKLWYRSWHQIPAASLPDDDDELCYLAELGFDLASFQSAKALALHGWVKCSDGRLYHPVVAEAALAAWETRFKQRHRTECARIKKHNQRHGSDYPYPDFDAFVASGCAPAQLDVPRDNPPLAATSPKGQPKLSPGTDENVPRENGSKGERRDILEEEVPNGTSSELADQQLPVLAQDQPDDVRLAFAAYEAMRHEVVPNARTVALSPDRAKKLRARLAEIGGLGGWQEVLAQIRGSPFLRGDDARSGRLVATIDWILNPTNLRKILEGNYDDTSNLTNRPAANAPGVRRSACDALIEARALTGFAGPPE